MARRGRWPLAAAAVLALVAALGWGTLRGSPARELRPRAPASPPPLAHVFVIVMENQSAGLLLQNPAAPYIRYLVRHYGYDSQYYGVTHPSLPNYVALIAGRTFGSHSDNPGQRFFGPTLPGQLTQRGISWLAVMQSLPTPGYRGAWYPAGAAGQELPSTLYAEKHDPFMLFPGLWKQDAHHVVPLRMLAADLRSGQIPALVFLVPNLCDDMHGQPSGPGAVCPASRGALLVRDGNDFLARWIPIIMHSRAWGRSSVIFVLWDEAGGGGSLNPQALRSYLAAGPEAPYITAALPFLGRLGGGRVPLIVIAGGVEGPRRVALWADHYSVLKTIETAWHLPRLGHARAAAVPLLTPLLSPTGP